MVVGVGTGFVERVLRVSVMSLTQEGTPYPHRCVSGYALTVLVESEGSMFIH